MGVSPRNSESFAKKTASGVLDVVSVSAEL